MSLENLRVDLLDETLVLRCITIAITVLKMATLGHGRMSDWGRSRVFGAQPPERFTTNNLFAPSHQLQHHGNNGQQVARRNALGRPVNVPTSRPINSKNRQTGQRVSRSTSEFAGPFCFRPPKTDVGGDRGCRQTKRRHNRLRRVRRGGHKRGVEPNVRATAGLLKSTTY